MFKFLTSLICLAITTPVISAPVPRERPLDPGIKGDLDIFLGTFSYTDNLGFPQVEDRVFIQTEKNAAGRFGIKDGDILRKINGEELESFPDWSQKFGMYRPGATLIFTIERDKDLIDIKVKIGEKK